MKATPARAGAGGRRPAARTRQGGGGLWLFLILAVPVSLVVLPTAIVVAVGLVPTLVAYIVDYDPAKTKAMTVGAVNLCGITPFAVELWTTSHTVAGALAVVLDPFAWLVMYGAAGAGWLFYAVFPALVANVEALRAEARIMLLEGRAKRMIEEWGPEVKRNDE